MEKDKTLKLRPTYFVKEILFPATRYCIGRHSYVSSYAEYYWNIIRENRKAISEDLLQFYARDIKSCIAQTMHWWDNVDVENAYNDSVVYDPYYLLSRYLHDHPEVDFASNDFHIDCISGEVVVALREKPLTDMEIAYNNMPNCDLEPWSKLARCISESNPVKLRDGSEVDAIEFYDVCRYDADEPWRWRKIAVPVHRWRSYIP